MPINFITNDPGAPGAQAATLDPSPERPETRVGFKIAKLPPEGIYKPDTPEFTAWQAREAAIRTVTVFEDICGELPGWTGKAAKRQLRLDYDAGVDINAYYNRTSVSFFHVIQGKKTTFSGASTDVVAHEVGHGILDALRPDLWNVHVFEINAFHEGFGDCMAVMVALSDGATRQAILAADPRLQAPNFVEATAEELAAAIARGVSPNHNAAKPRHALNDFKWTFSSNLPAGGKPGVLIEEIHSFGQLTSGCFYDLIAEIFRAGPGGQGELWNACKVATKLLAQAVINAPVHSRFLESVGKTMLLADRQLNPVGGVGRNEASIRAAFDRHGIQLSVTNFLAPRAALLPRGKAKGRAAKKRIGLPTAARHSFRSFLEVDADAPVSTREFTLDEHATHVTTEVAVDLTGISERLQNVRALTPVEALVRPVDGMPALVGAVEPGMIVSNEVRSYVSLLVDRKLIDFGEAKRRGKGAGYAGLEGTATYGLKRSGDAVYLERLRFACCCACAGPAVGRLRIAEDAGE